jgi:hypothetical protein
VPLVVSPRDGAVQRYMQDHWARPLAERLRLAGAVLNLFTNDRATVHAELPYTGDLLYIGHGTADALGEPVLIDSRDLAMVDGMVVAIACRSGQRLAAEAIRGGVTTYVGFIDDVHVIDSSVLDQVVVDYFAPLLTARWSATEFETRFKAVCETVQHEHFAGRKRRAANAHLIASAAQVMKLTVRVY